MTVAMRIVCEVAYRPKLSDPAHRTHGLQPECDGRVRCSARLCENLSTELNVSRGPESDKDESSARPGSEPNPALARTAGRVHRAGQSRALSRCVRGQSGSLRTGFHPRYHSQHRSATVRPGGSAQALPLRLSASVALLAAAGSRMSSERGSDLATGQAGPRLQNHRRLSQG